MRALCTLTLHRGREGNQSFVRSLEENQICTPIYWKVSYEHVSANWNVILRTECTNIIY